ncbi:FAD-binding oxidoreductase [Altericroceibacterium xinjiangense]|uniref:FAD-binding oxidoreductase n=1 Tax=Altericroceibacterium xinjiangense TaxID=762261 RepID=UPI000F7E9791|nr:FAD-binding oxidoreductase [Altericroceibacterium xinjiangense]
MVGFAKNSVAYERAREALIWNQRLHDARSPERIVEARSTRDVVEAVEFARLNGLKVSVRGSGHDYQASALRDGGVLIDLGPLDGISIDAEKRQAWVGAGAKGGALLEALSDHGLAFPVGHCPDVALSGYLLGGGFGWNFGEWGPACLSVTEIEVVTAAGEILRANEDSHPDVFWAARGAGSGFFAVVTRYRLKLYPLPKCVHVLSATFPLERVPAIADWLDTATLAADSKVEITCIAGSVPQVSGPGVHLQVVATGDDDAEVRNRLTPFRDRPAAVDRAGAFEEKPMGFADLPQLSAMPSGKRMAGDYLWTDASPGELLRAAQPVAEGPSIATISIFSPGGDGCDAPDPGLFGCALSVGCGASAGIYALWDDPADDEAHLAWVSGADAALAPHRKGRYVGETDLTAGPERVEDCFAPACLDRLRALRERYDPEDRFFSFLT